MSDFLISLDKHYSGRALLDLIKKPYGIRAPAGQYSDFSWGSLAVLEERLAFSKNIIVKDGVLFAWVGDLVTNLWGDFQEIFLHHLIQLRRCANEDSVSLITDSLFEKLNGAFAILVADDSGFSIVTDPMNFVPVYTGTDASGDAVAFGTHPDLVATISQNTHNIDLVSIAEFLNAGNCTFPYTMYKNVKEIGPGRIHVVQISGSNEPNVKDCVYWTPPQELSDNYKENELAEELRSALLSAVKDRCDGQKVGVLLSGGLDSRVVMAAVPKSVDCVGLTFCNAPNRETHIASRVARCYDRKWHLLVRDVEFLADNTLNIVKLTGCEFDWVNGQTIGFFDEIHALSVDALLTGFLFDTYLKSCYAVDIVRVKRMGGLLPPHYEKSHLEWARHLTDFCRLHLKSEIVKSIHARQYSFYKEMKNNNRSSVEWFAIYPFSQSLAGEWIAGRRLLPIRLVATDRRILNFTFKCPVELKLNGRIFQRSTKELLGKGMYIPNANDGIRPHSGYWSRLAQRSIRKLEDRTINILKKLSKEPRIQHSWHDYQKYWQESKRLKELIHEYGANLDEFYGMLFKEKSRDLFQQKDLHWQDGFRLLQLAIWKSLVENYGLQSENVK